jgi:hypothetical protein
MGSSFLRKLTLVKQTGYGTSTTDLGSATNGIIPTGLKGDWHDLSEFAQPGDSEYNGFIYPTSRIIKLADMAEVPFDGDLTFENADYIFGSGWVDGGAPTVIGTTGQKRYYLAPPEGTINSPKFVTVLAGDNSTPGSGKGYAMLDAFVPSFDISAARGGFTQVSGTFSGHTLAALTTPQYSNITNVRLGATSIPAWLWKLTIVDGTPFTGTYTGLIDWSLKVNSAFHHKKFQDGQVSPTTWGQGRTEVTLDMTFEQNASALTEFGKFQAGTPRLIQLLAVGPAIAGGTAFKTINLQLEGHYTAFDKPGDSDGNTTLKASFKAYSTTATGGGFYMADYVISATASLF